MKSWGREAESRRLHVYNFAVLASISRDKRRVVLDSTLKTTSSLCSLQSLNSLWPLHPFFLFSQIVFLPLRRHGQRRAQTDSTQPSLHFLISFHCFSSSFIVSWHHQGKCPEKTGKHSHRTTLTWQSKKKQEKKPWAKGCKWQVLSFILMLIHTLLFFMTWSYSLGNCCWSSHEFNRRPEKKKNWSVCGNTKCLTCRLNESMTVVQATQEEEHTMTQLWRFCKTWRPIITNHEQIL